jgi:hypothetical protein
MSPTPSMRIQQTRTSAGIPTSSCIFGSNTLAGKHNYNFLSENSAWEHIQWQARKQNCNLQICGLASNQHRSPPAPRFSQRPTFYNGMDFRNSLGFVISSHPLLVEYGQCMIAPMRKRAAHPQRLWLISEAVHASAAMHLQRSGHLKLFVLHHRQRLSVQISRDC